MTLVKNVSSSDGSTVRKTRLFRSSNTPVSVHVKMQSISVSSSASLPITAKAVAAVVSAAVLHNLKTQLAVVDNIKKTAL